MSQEKIDKIHVVDESNIKGFFGEFRFLSNFHPCEIEFEGLTYPSIENAYQAAKTLDKNERLKFTNITPAEAKKLGRTIKLRSDWDEVKVRYMIGLTIEKYNNKNLADMLLATEDAYLEETNYWGDTFWGVSDGKGKNKLGLILMLVRIKAKAERFLFQAMLLQTKSDELIKSIHE